MQWTRDIYSVVITRQSNPPTVFCRGRDFAYKIV